MTIEWPIVAALVGIHADIDHACAQEVLRAKQHAESVRRSIAAKFAWAFVRRR